MTARHAGAANATGATKDPPTPQAAQAPDVNFNPFILWPELDGTKGMKSRWFALPGAIIGFGAVLAAVADGRFGSLKDFQLVADVRRVFDIGPESPSTPNFPLIRDYPSWILAVVIAVTGAIIHWQWRSMERFYESISGREPLGPCLLEPKPKLRTGRLQRLIYGDGLDFKAALERSQRPMHWVEKGWKRGSVVVVAAVIVFLVMWSEERYGVFGVLKPSVDTSARDQLAGCRTGWIECSYDSWWAGSENMWGLLVYFIAATFGLYIILLQNIAGLSCVHAVAVLGHFYLFKADWTNSDGRYGWGRVTRTLETVGVSLVVHGLTLGMLLVTLGISNFRWLLGLVALWVIVIPIYLVIPWRVFGRVRNSREDRVKELRLRAESVTAEPMRLLAERAARQEIEFVRRARLHPMARKRLLVPLFISFVLPILLTSAQIVVPLRFGRSGTTAPRTPATPAVAPPTGVGPAAP